MAVPTAPTSCRVLTLLPDNNRIQLISTSRHITQGPVDLVRVEQNAKGDRFAGTSHLIKNDSYQLRFVFPRGTNCVVTRAVARSGWRKLPVKISNHQGWASVEITSPKTQDVDWEVEFGPGKGYDFPPSAPVQPFVRRVGLDGAQLNWQEQYYLNAGYQVYLDGKLLGQTPEAQFPLRGLVPHSNYTARVSAIWENGHESPLSKEVQFNLAALAPEELALDELSPVQANGNWSGYEIEELLAMPALAVAGQNYPRGLNAFVNSELEYDLFGLYDTFTAQVGLDDRSPKEAAAEFVVLGDGKELWRSGIIATATRAQEVKLNVAGVHKLTLKTISAKVPDRRGQIDWIAPKVLRAMR
jgi:hypothetical protein